MPDPQYNTKPVFASYFLLLKLYVLYRIEFMISCSSLSSPDSSDSLCLLYLKVLCYHANPILVDVIQLYYFYIDAM